MSTDSCASTDAPLPVLFEDASLVAIDKPAGLLVHRTAIDAHETRFALQVLRDQLGHPVYPCHRLDKATSGVLLFAKSREVLQALRVQFDAGTVHKEYLAVVRGWPDSSGRIDSPLKYESGSRGDRRPREPQPACTDFVRLATCELEIPNRRHPSSRYALLRMCPRTGRKHQLRRHMAHIRHPIIGDTAHGDGSHNRIFRTHFGCHRLLLVASSLAFVHPENGRPCRITSPAAHGFGDLLRLIGLTPSAG